MTLCCFNQLPSHFTRILVLIDFNGATRLKLDGTGDLMQSPDNPFNFHAEILLLCGIFLETSKSWLKH